MGKRKARKMHECYYCNRNIKPGEKYIVVEGRIPELNEADEQIGIKYYRYKWCLNCDEKLQNGEKIEKI